MKSLCTAIKCNCMFNALTKEFDQYGSNLEQHGWLPHTTWLMSWEKEDKDTAFTSSTR